MAQIIDNVSNSTSGVKTERSAGWLDALLRDGPRVMLALFGLGIGAGLMVRLFIGEFVQDYKMALVLTVVSCGLMLLVVAGAPFLIWIIRETSKAAVAGVSQQVSETNALVQSSIQQNTAVTSALVQLTGAYLGKQQVTISAPAPANPVPQIGKADLVKTGENQMISRDMLITMATDIYNRMYAQQIPPTQENVRKLTNITSNGHISKALDVLAGWGVCTTAQQGREREWIYGDSNDSEA